MQMVSARPPNIPLRLLSLILLRAVPPGFVAGVVLYFVCIALGPRDPCGPRGPLDPTNG